MSTGLLELILVNLVWIDFVRNRTFEQLIERCPSCVSWVGLVSVQVCGGCSRRLQALLSSGLFWLHPVGPLTSVRRRLPSPDMKYRPTTLRRPTERPPTERLTDPPTNRPPAGRPTDPPTHRPTIPRLLPTDRPPTDRPIDHLPPTH